MHSEILVVDDDPRVAQVAAKTLRAAGYSVNVAASCREALNLARPSLAVAIVDLYFGSRLQGIDIADRLRQATSADVIFATGQPDVETAVDALRHGAYDYLVKPFLTEDLLLAVKRCLDRREIAAELAREQDLRRRLAEEISLRKRAEAQMLQVQKMDAIGRLATAIAHDFNNYLTAIGGSIHLIRRMDLNEAAQAEIGELKKASDDASLLVRQILSFVRPERSAAESIDANAVIRDMKGLIARVMRSNVQISLDLAPDLPRIRLNGVHLKQVVMNLCANARDAMANEGLLTIRTRVLDLEAGGPSLHPDSRAGRYVALEVSDSGSGMTTEIRERLFEPFFSTKPAAQGTGLGLSTVYTIVRRAKGSLEVTSEPGHGTMFHIYFPAVQEPAGRRNGERAYSEDSARA